MPIEVVIATIPNLEAGQTGFKLGSGELFVVETVRLDVTSPVTQVEQYHHWRVRAWRVNADGTTYVDPQTQRPVEMPAKTENILTSALAEGAITVESELQRASQEAGTRFTHHLAAHHANKQVPLAK